MSLVRSAALRSGLARISAMRSVESVAARLSGVVALRLSDVVALRLSGAVAQAPSTDAIAPSTASEKDAFRMSRVAMTRSMAPLYRSRAYARPASDFAADGGRSHGDGPTGPRGVRRFRDGAPDRTSPHTFFFWVLAPRGIPKLHAFPLLHRLRPAQRQTNEDLEHFDAGMGA